MLDEAGFQGIEWIDLAHLIWSQCVWSRPWRDILTSQIGGMQVGAQDCCPSGASSGDEPWSKLRQIIFEANVGMALAREVEMQGLTVMTEGGCCLLIADRGVGRSQQKWTSYGAFTGALRRDSRYRKLLQNDRRKMY